MTLWDSEADWQRFRDEKLAPALADMGQTLEGVEPWPIDAVRDSRFVGFSGMGHDLPRALWPEFVGEIAAPAARLAATALRRMRASRSRPQNRLR